VRLPGQRFPNLTGSAFSDALRYAFGRLLPRWLLSGPELSRATPSTLRWPGTGSALVHLPSFPPPSLSLLATFLFSPDAPFPTKTSVAITREVEAAPAKSLKVRTTSESFFFSSIWTGVGGVPARSNKLTGSSKTPYFWPPHVAPAHQLWTVICVFGCRPPANVQRTVPNASSPQLFPRWDSHSWRSPFSLAQSCRGTIHRAPV